MINKSIIDSHLDHFKNLENELQVDQTITEQINVLRNDVEQFSIKVLAVGAFSAGKSALLNYLLGEEFLTEEQTPETAIATELQYFPIDSYEVVNMNNECLRIEKADLATLDPENCMNIRYKLNNKFLSKFEGYTFVDMPGFNSSISQHNRAILQYVNQGNAYLLVIDCEDGGIKASTLEFIEEIRQYEHNLIVVLSKTDKKTPSELKVIEDNVVKQVNYLFGFPIPVVKYSKYDDTAQEQMYEAISQLNDQNIFEQTIFPKIKEIYHYFELTLEKYIQSLSYDDNKLKEEIYKRQKAKKDLEYKLGVEKSKLSNRMQGQVLPKIIGEVESTLYANTTELANAAISGTQVFSSKVNTILRPVLIENTKKYTEESFEEFIKEINISSMLVDNTEDIVAGVSDKLHKIDTILADSEKLVGNFNKIYKSVTAVLAIATTAIAPWLELIILFLPEILKVIGIGGKNSQINKVKQSIENQVIPQIIEKLRPEIEKSLVEVEQTLLEELENNLNTIISVEEEALQLALSKHSEMLEQHDNVLQKYQSLLQLVKEELKRIG